MAKFITRRFIGTKAEVLVYDKELGATISLDFMLNGKFNSDEAIEKAVIKKIKNYPQYRFIVVTSVFEVNEMRRMSVDDFIKGSEVVE